MRRISVVGAWLLLCVLALGWTTTALAAPVEGARELSSGLIVPAAAKPGPDFEVEHATQAYVELLNAEQRAKSDAYFEGGYWIGLWQALIGVAAAALLLFSGASRTLWAWAQRVGRWRFVHTMIYSALYVLTMTLLTLPWEAYAGFWREHQYGLATQTLGEWLGDGLIGLLVSMVMVAPLIGLLYIAVRRAGRAWWAWAGGILAAGILFIQMIGPVFIAPLFNTYTSMPDGPLRESVLAMAREHNIPADDVYVFDASKQTTRISANVSGLFGTTRISLNDNLLERTSDQEIRAVMGHEMGHYVLNHALKLTLYISLVLALGLLVVHLCFDASLRRFGARWGVSGRDDPAGLPLAVALLTVYMTLMQPVLNTLIRTAEAEADAFGLDAAGEPHGFSTAAMRLSTYRKIQPGAWEEILFYDHPSGYDRVRRSMTWLSEHPDDPRVQAAVAAGRPGVEP